MEKYIGTDEVEKNYSLSALSRESGIRRKTLYSWIECGWLVGNKVSDAFELYTNAQLKVAIIRANRALGRSAKVSLLPEEKGNTTLQEFTTGFINNQNNTRKNK